MTSQQIASVLRQIGAVLVSVYGVLSASVTALHLPIAVSTVLTAAGPAILAIEHYVGDPTTGLGTPVKPTPPPVAAPPVPPGSAG